MAATCRRPGSGPPPIMSMTSRSGVPIGSSATPWRGVWPVTVHTIVPGDSSVPIERNHSAPRARMPGTFASVSTLFARVGGASVARLEQGGLFAVEILGRPLEHAEVDVPRPAGGVDLADRSTETLGLGCERLLDRDDHRLGADRERRDERALEHAVRVGPHDRPIL